MQLAKTQGHSIQEFLSDNGGEFDNVEERNVFKMYGVTQRLTTPYTPQQNGFSERENRTVIEMVRTLRFSNRNVQFPDSIWAELVNLHFKSNTQNNYRRKQEQAI